MTVPDWVWIADLMIEAYNTRYLMPSRLDGLQDAGLHTIEEE